MSSFLWKTNFPNFFCLKLDFYIFSSLSLTDLIIKSQKQTFAKRLKINFANCLLLLARSLHFLMKNLFFILIPNPYQIIFHSFMVKFNISYIKQLKSHKQNIHYDCEVFTIITNRKLFHWKTNFRFSKGFDFKLCFFTFFTFEFNIFNKKVPETKHAHLLTGLQFTLQTVHFFCFLENKLL